MIFLSIFFALNGLTHIVVYRFFLRCTGFTHPLAKAVLVAVFSILAVSFMASFFLLRWSENPWTVAFFQFSAVWFALSVQLLLAAAVSWALSAVLRQLGVSPAHLRPLSAGCALLALAWAGVGFWNAFHPVVTRVEVAIDHLPEGWHHRRIVQLSDVHLGHFHTAGRLERLVERINQLSPDLIAITGDLFDGMVDGMPRFAEPLARLKARHGAFFVTGNHEVYAGLRRSLDVAARAGLHVLSNEVVRIEGLNLMGIAYPGVKDRNEIRGLDLLLDPAEPRRPSILLFHTPTDIRTDAVGDRRTDTYWRPDTSFALSRELGVSLQLSGHTHHGQMFPFGVLTRWIFKGYDYGLHREDGFSLYTSSGVGTWGPPMRTASTPEIVVITLLPGRQ